MNNNKLSRIIAALLLAVLAAYLVQSMDAGKTDLGREAFLAKQAALFDSKAAHPGIGRYLFLGLIASCVYLGVYEVLSFCSRKILNKINAGD